MSPVQDSTRSKTSSTKRSAGDLQEASIVALQEAAEKRRAQNRIAQRNFRRKFKESRAQLAEAENNTEGQTKKSTVNAQPSDKENGSAEQTSQQIGQEQLSDDAAPASHDQDDDYFVMEGIFKPSEDGSTQQQSADPTYIHSDGPTDQRSLRDMQMRYQSCFPWDIPYFKPYPSPSPSTFNHSSPCMQMNRPQVLSNYCSCTYQFGACQFHQHDLHHHCVLHPDSSSPWLSRLSPPANPIIPITIGDEMKIQTSGLTNPEIMFSSLSDGLGATLPMIGTHFIKNGSIPPPGSDDCASRHTFGSMINDVFDFQERHLSSASTQGTVHVADNSAKFNFPALRSNATQGQKTTLEPPDFIVEGTPSIDSRLSYVLEAIENAGFESFDHLATSFYTCSFEKNSAADRAQHRSRGSQLRSMLAALREDTIRWTRWEARGYQDEIIKSAETMYVQEMSSLTELLSKSNMVAYRSKSTLAGAMPAIAGSEPTSDTTMFGADGTVTAHDPGLSVSVASSSSLCSMWDPREEVELSLAGCKRQTSSTTLDQVLRLYQNEMPNIWTLFLELAAAAGKQGPQIELAAANAILVLYKLSTKQEIDLNNSILD